MCISLVLLTVLGFASTGHIAGKDSFGGQAGNLGLGPDFSLSTYGLPYSSPVSIEVCILACQL